MAEVTGALKIGARMHDGTIYAGISPDTGKAMYTTPGDAKLSYTFNQAQAYAAKLDAHGHHDWHIPSKGELNVLFQSRAAIGGFDETGAAPYGWYWSSSPVHNSVWSQRFNDGGHAYGLESSGEGIDSFSSLRCVR